MKLKSDGFRREAEQGYDLNANTWSKACGEQGGCFKVSDVSLDIVILKIEIMLLLTDRFHSTGD